MVLLILGMRAMMQGRTKWLIARVALIASVAVTGSCARERGLAPIDARDVVYLSLNGYPDSEFSGKLCILDACSFVLMDSLRIAALEVFASSTPSEIVVVVFDTASADYTARVSLLDTQTGATRLIVDRAQKVTALAGGRAIAVNWSLDDHARLYDTRSGQLINIISDDTRIAHSDATGYELLYTSLGDSRRSWDDTLLMLVDARNGDSLGSLVPRSQSGGAVSVVSARLHPDGSRALILGVTHSGDRLIVLGDMHSGQTLFTEGIGDIGGEVAVSPDGIFAAVSDPGNAFTGGPRYVDVFDLHSHRRIARVDQEEGLPNRSVGYVLFLSDTLLLSAPTSLGWNTGPLCLIDSRTFTVIDTIALPDTDTSAGFYPGLRAICMGKELKR